MNTVIVVGDKFEAFARNKAVIRVSDLESRLERGDCGDDELFELGQGVGIDRIGSLVRLADAKGRRKQLLFDAVAKCGTAQVHKVRYENSLLTMPAQTGHLTFEAALLLDDQSELLSDHIGGQHLPGMILVEAVRQMGLAVVEQFFAAEFPHGCGFLWTSINMNFVQFAFPIKTVVVSRIRERRVVKTRREVFSFDFEFTQRGAVVASCQSSVEVHDRRVVERQERGVAAALFEAAGPTHAQVAP